jgi:hypothetical protein
LAFPIVIVLRAKRTGAKAEQGLSKTLVAIATAAMSRPPAQALRRCHHGLHWPYITCVGTEFGNPHVRLISIDRPA